MEHSNYNSTRNLAILSTLLATTIIIFIFWELITIKFLYTPQEYSTNISNSSFSPKDELRLALEKASTANKTVIIAFINEAYVEPHEGEFPSMFDIFLEGFWVGEGTKKLVDHLLVVAMDKTAHERCRFRRLNCYRLAAEGDGTFAGEKLFMSGEFIEMMWRRTHFLLDVLKKGYNFIFTDTDVLWLRNPFQILNGTLEFQISTDRFNGDPLSDQNPINTGFYFIRSNNKTTSLFEKWYEARVNSSGMKEQDVLGNLIKGNHVLTQLNISARFLDTLYFSGFCSDSHDVGLVATVHANCCRTIKAKVVDLKNVLRDWKRSGSGHPEKGPADFRWTSHTSCVNSWHN